MYKNNIERTKEANQVFSKEKLLKSLVSTHQPVIFDIGANIGQSVDYFKSIWQYSKIYSFEPVSASFETLQNNVKCYDNIKCYKIALSNYIGNSKFYINEHQIMLSGFYNLNKHSRDSLAVNQPEPSHFNYFNSSEATVQVETLDFFCKANNVEKIDLLKLDTQGAEPLILEGASEILKNTSVIISELMLYDLYEKQVSFIDYEKILIPLGFRLYDISHISKNPLNGRTDWVEVIYIK